MALFTGSTLLWYPGEVQGPFSPVLQLMRGCVVHTLILAPERQRKAQLCELEASVV